MKILFFSHAPRGNTYGAAKSLKLFLDCLEDNKALDYAIVYRNKFPGLFNFKKYKNGEYSLYLPVKYNYYNASKFTNFLVSFLNFSTNYKKIYKLIKTVNPEIIHFNSFVMYPLIEKIAKNPYFSHIKIVCHIREPLSQNIDKSKYKFVGRIDKFIFIDKSTEIFFNKIFSQINASKKTTLPNLIKAGKNSRLLQNKDVINFAYMGRVDKSKGVFLISKAFADPRLKNCTLLIYGSGISLEKIKVYFLTLKHKNIFFKGLKLDLLKSDDYLSIDAVIRGEKIFSGFGRVGYETLTSQKVLVVPDDPILRELKNSNPSLGIETYIPNNLESLKEKLVEISNKNLADYSFAIEHSIKEELWLENPIYVSNFAVSLYTELLNEIPKHKKKL